MLFQRGLEKGHSIFHETLKTAFEMWAESIVRNNIVYLVVPISKLTLHEENYKVCKATIALHYLYTGWPS